MSLSPCFARRSPGRPTALATVCALGASAWLAACGSDRPVGPGTEPPGAGPLASLGTNPQIGKLVSLNADTANCRTTNLRIGYRTARVVAVGTRSVIVADTANPANGFTASDYQNFATAFDDLVYPVDTRHFGVPTDIDRNGRVVIFFTTAVNAMTPRQSDYVVGGFFFNRDLFPTTGTANAGACAGSNQGELFYMLAPDPSGTVNGNQRTVANVRQSTVGILGHEFQHLINAGRRLYVLNAQKFDEDVWLNEGLSHVAEELNFYQAAGLSPAGQPGQSPRAELTAAALTESTLRTNALNGFNLQNLLRFSQYLGATERNSPYADNDSLATRGATWSLLRYTADRTGRRDSAFTYALVNSTTTSVANLRAAVATVGIPSVEGLLRDWAVANYADGLASGLGATYDDPSWAYRDALTGLIRTNGTPFNKTYPLVPRALAAEQPQAAPIAPGGASYFTFSVPAGATATLRVTAGGSAPSATTRAALFEVAAGRVTPFDGSAAGTVTVANTGGSAAQYAFVLVNADLTSAAVPSSTATTYTVTGTGIGTSAALASVAQAGPTLARLSAALGTPGEPVITDAPLLQQLRAGAVRELTPLLPEARVRFAARGRPMMAPVRR